MFTDPVGPVELGFYYIFGNFHLIVLSPVNLAKYIYWLMFKQKIRKINSNGVELENTMHYLDWFVVN